MVYARFCVQLSVTAPGDRKNMSIKGVWDWNYCVPLLLASLLGGIKGAAARHCKSDMYVCDFCNRSFSTQRSLKRHRESVHRQSASFCCQVCSKRFYRKDELQRHLKTHQPPMLLAYSVTCPTDATVDLPPPLPPSPSKKHGERPVCDLCTYTFASQKTLKRHRQTVHRQSGGFRIECAIDAFTEETNSRGITSVNMPTRSTKHWLATVAPFVRRASTIANIWENTWGSIHPPSHRWQHALRGHWRHQPLLCTPTH